MDISTINLVINGSLILLGVALGYFVTKQTYIFQRGYESKLVLIIDLYKNVVNLEFELREYLHFIGADFSRELNDKKISSLNKIKSDFQKFQHKFWEVEIILDDEVTKEIQEFLNKYITITSKLTASNIMHQQGDNNNSFKMWDESFQLAASDLAKIKEKIKKVFRYNLKK